MENPELTGQELIADLYIHKKLEDLILAAGFWGILHIDDVDYKDIEVLELIHKIDPKTNKRIKKKPLFAKHGDRVICRIQVFKTAGTENSYDFQPSQRFKLYTIVGEEFAELKVMELDKVNKFSTQPIFASSTTK